MKVLVIGGNGYIGKALVSKLGNLGFETHVPKTEDVSLKNLLNLNKKFDWVINLASRNDILESISEPEKYYRNNIDVCLLSLEFARIVGAKHLFPSTFVYEKKDFPPYLESDPVLARNPYTHSKIICESLCDSYSKMFDVKGVVLRIFNIYGPNMPNNSFLKKLIEKISSCKNEKILLKGQNIKRDFIHLDDVVDAIISSLKYDGFNIFNICSQSSTDRSILAQEIAKKVNPNLIIEMIKDDIELVDTLGSNEKFSSFFDWKPRKKFEDNLNQIFDD